MEGDIALNDISYWNKTVHKKTNVIQKGSQNKGFKVTLVSQHLSSLFVSLNLTKRLMF